jgi:hypothetical protein
MPPRKRTQRWREEPDKSMRRATTRIRGAGGMLEQDLQDAIVEMCQWFGLYVYHPYDSRRSTSGYPDLTIIAKGGVMFRELKTEKGHLRPDQAKVLELLRLSGQDAGVWRPSDLALGNIRQELQEFSRRKPK